MTLTEKAEKWTREWREKIALHRESAPFKEGVRARKSGLTHVDVPDGLSESEREAWLAGYHSKLLA